VPSAKVSVVVPTPAACSGHRLGADSFELATPRHWPPLPAQRFLHQALALCDQPGDRRGTGRWLNLLGYLAWHNGDLVASRYFHWRSLALNRELSDRCGTAWALHRLSVTLVCLAERGVGEAADVRPLAEEGLTIGRELGERRHFAYALCDLATVAILERDFELAHRRATESQRIFSELGGGPHWLVWILVVEEFLLATAGDLGSAVRVFGGLLGALREANFKVERFPEVHRQLFERHQLLAEAPLGSDVIAKNIAQGEATSPSEALAYAESACAAVAQPDQNVTPRAPVW
jgi:hypothetical protein